jgi:hemolysin III
VAPKQEARPDQDHAIRELARRADAAVHFLGLAFAFVAVPLLLLKLSRPDVGTSLARSVCAYGVCMIAMLGASALFHLSPARSWKPLLRRIDHTAIYLKIAASYGVLAVLSGAGWLLPAVWSAALLGAGFRMLGPVYSWRTNLSFYLLLSIGTYLAIGSELATLSLAAHRLAQTGGAIYLAGVLFFLRTALPFHRAIWHAFVLAATVCVYAAVLVELTT